jgi:hypothetical protein
MTEVREVLMRMELLTMDWPWALLPFAVMVVFCHEYGVRHDGVTGALACGFDYGGMLVLALVTLTSFLPAML